MKQILKSHKVHKIPTYVIFFDYDKVKFSHNI